MYIPKSDGGVYMNNCCKMVVVLLTVILLQLPVSALGTLKVQVMPKDPVAGEEVRILVMTGITNKPVEGAKVYVKSDIIGKTLIGETDSNGELKYTFEEPGTYMIGVEKEGYASLPVESGEVVVVKPTPTPVIPTPEMTPTPTPMITPTPETTPGFEIGLGEKIKEKVEKIKENVEEAKEKAEEVKEKVEEKIEEKKEEVKEILKILKVENPKVVEAGKNVKIAVSYNGQPVDGATVTITKRGVVVKSGKTVDGAFVTKFDEEGVYVITATKEGYRSGKSAIAVVSAKEVSIPRFVHVMPVIEPEKPEVVRINKAFIEDLKLRVKKAVEDVVIDVKELRELLKDVKKPQGKVCVYIEINVSIESDALEEGEIKFNVSKEWLMENNLDKHSIKLKKYVDGEWITLDTEIVGEDDRHVYYVARTPGFSIYAIVGEETAKPATTQTPTSEALGSAETETIKTPAEEKSEKTPGFEILSGLLAGGMALALRRRI